MLSVSAFSFLHQFIFCQSRPLPTCSVEGECWGREKGGGRLFRGARLPWLPNASNTFRIMLLTQWQLCEVYAENITMPQCLSLTLEMSYPTSWWHGEKNQESSMNGKDWEHYCLLIDMGFVFSRVFGWSIILLVGNVWTRYWSFVLFCF